MRYAGAQGGSTRVDLYTACPASSSSAATEPATAAAAATTAAHTTAAPTTAAPTTATPTTLAPDDAIVKLNWPDSSTWINSGSTLPTYNSSDGSWVFNRAQSQYFDAGPRTLNPHLSGFTVTSRVLWSETGMYQRIIDFGSDGGTNSCNSILWALALESTKLHLSVIIPNSGSQRHVFFDSDISLQLHTWYVITMTYNATTTSFKIYIDGALRHTVAATSAVTGPRIASNTYIGKSPWSGEAFFSGRMKFLAVYDRALSEAEILSQHATQAPTVSFTQVTSVSFIIASSDRITGKSSVTVTLGFTPVTSLPPGGTITLTYPSGFFAPSVTPTVASGASSVAGLSLACSATAATSVVMTTSGATIFASQFTVTISGFTMGLATAGVVGISAQTSADTVASSAVASGPIAGGTWSTAQLSVNRFHLAATSVGNFSIFAGGSTTTAGDNSGISNVVDLYNSATGAWSTAQLSVARMSLAATSVGILSLFVGGYGVVNPSAAVDLYNSATGAWSTAQLSVARTDLAAASVGTLAIFAGGSSAVSVDSIVDVYNSITGAWSTARLSVARRIIAATTVGNMAVFAGGLTAGEPLTASDAVDL